MSLIIFNFFWMTYNIFLSIIPVILAFLYFKTDKKRILIRTFLCVLWLLFLPNSIYLFTDIVHLFQQLKIASGLVALLLILQYFVLEIYAVLTFILSTHPFEKELQKKVSINSSTFIIIALNFLVSFGVILGNVKRLNSWDVLISPNYVVQKSIDTLLSLNLMLVVILFGLFANFLYFLLRKKIADYINTYLVQVDVSM